MDSIKQPSLHSIIENFLKIRDFKDKVITFQLSLKFKLDLEIMIIMPGKVPLKLIIVAITLFIVIIKEDFKKAFLTYNYLFELKGWTLNYYNFKGINSKNANFDYY